MSDATLAREGYTVMLDALLEALVPWVRLYTNDPVISLDRVRADFTELVGHDYAPYPIPRWTPAALRGGSAYSVPDIIQFKCPGAPWWGAVRGYFVTAGRDGPLLWAWRRPGDDPFVFSADTPLIQVFIELRFPVAGGP